MTKLKLLFLSLTVALLSNSATAGDIRSAMLEVKGMTCASCPLTVKQVLKKQTGVREASVDFKSQTALVKFDPETIQPAQLAKAVSDFGFPTTIKK